MIALWVLTTLVETAEPAQCAVPPPVAPKATDKNVQGGALAACNPSLRAGFTRSGTCATGPDDVGVHVVCAEVSPAFLEFTRARGNDLSTPRPELDFPGLKPGDRWCLCASRWAEADAAGVAPPVVLEATHEKAASIVPRARLERAANPARTRGTR